MRPTASPHEVALAHGGPFAKRFRPHDHPEVYATQHAVENALACPEADSAMEDVALGLLEAEVAGPEAEAASGVLDLGGLMSLCYSQGRVWRERLWRGPWTPHLPFARLAFSLQSCCARRVP